MKRINAIVFIILLGLSINTIDAQTKVLKGQIVASSELEGIHVLNLSAEEYTVSNSKGVFSIEVAIRDSILISSIQYIPKTIQITTTEMNTDTLVVVLEDRVNELDEVVVGKILTGDLNSDIKNSDAKRDINFYDVGIPGYTGKPKTQKERRLLEADGGKFVYYYGLVATINIHKILNRISGRTKKLETLVRLEQQDKCMHATISELSDNLFGHITIDDSLKTEFFYYASEDPEFLKICQQENDLKMYEFLVLKLLNFNEQSLTKTD